MFSNPLPPVSNARYLRPDNTNTLVDFAPVEGASKYEITVRITVEQSETILKRDCSILLTHQDMCVVEIVALTSEGIRSSEVTSITVPEAEPEEPELPQEMSPERDEPPARPPLFLSPMPERESTPAVASGSHGLDSLDGVAGGGPSSSDESGETEESDDDEGDEGDEGEEDGDGGAGNDDEYMQDGDHDENEVMEMLLEEYRRRRRRRRIDIPRWERLTLHRLKHHRVSHVSFVPSSNQY